MWSHAHCGIYFINWLVTVPSVLWRCWLGGRKGIRPVKNWVVRCWRGYLSGARCRLHTAQLMPLPLSVSCFSKIQIGFTFLVPVHPGSPGERAVKRVCVCVCVWLVTVMINVFIKFEMCSFIHSKDGNEVQNVKEVKFLNKVNTQTKQSFMLMQLTRFLTVLPRPSVTEMTVRKLPAITFTKRHKLPVQHNTIQSKLQTVTNKKCCNSLNSIVKLQNICLLITSIQSVICEFCLILALANNNCKLLVIIWWYKAKVH